MPTMVYKYAKNYRTPKFEAAIEFFLVNPPTTTSVTFKAYKTDSYTLYHKDNLLAKKMSEKKIEVYHQKGWSLKVMAGDIKNAAKELGYEVKEKSNLIISKYEPSSIHKIGIYKTTSESLNPILQSASTTSNFDHLHKQWVVGALTNVLSKATIAAPDKFAPIVKPEIKVLFVTKTVSSTDIGDIWQLDKNPLSRYIADHYMLNVLSYTYPDDMAITTSYVEQRDRLAGLIHRYLDMAIGGELRHGHAYSNIRNSPKYVPFRDKISHVGSHSRKAAWKEWADIRKQAPNALKLAAECFRLPGWSFSIGGEQWAKVTDIVLKYESGEITKGLFIDMTVDLQHNTGIVFNKWWESSSDLSALNKVLYHKLHGKYSALAMYCSAPVCALYDKNKIADD